MARLSVLLIVSAAGMLTGQRGRVGGDPTPNAVAVADIDRRPTDADLSRLKSVEGAPSERVVRVLGRPRTVTRRPDGTEVWDYGWPAACRVWLKDGVCVGTFYTAGY